MAIYRDKTQPKIFTGVVDPNTVGTFIPTKIGDIYVDTTAIQLYFAFGMAGTQWGTCGTAGG